MKGRTADEVLAGQVVAADRYTADLVVRASTSTSDELDEVIGRLARAAGRSSGCRPWTSSSCARPATNWRIARTSPPGAVLSEAVDLAGRYGTDDSSRFVNGLLATAAAELRPTRHRPPPERSSRLLAEPRIRVGRGR